MWVFAEALQFLRLVGNADANSVIIQNKLSGKLSREKTSEEAAAGDRRGRAEVEKITSQRKLVCKLGVIYQCQTCHSHIARLNFQFIVAMLTCQY